VGQHLDLPATQSVACPRVPVRQVRAVLPAKYLEALEQNQQIASCCRHPENHEVEALYSGPQAEGVPDIYIFHCTCGRKHSRFCVGGSEGFKRGLRDEFECDADGKPIPHRELRPFWGTAR
jgi:hypothetical protein